MYADSAYNLLAPNDPEACHLEISVLGVAEPEKFCLQQQKKSQGDLTENRCVLTLKNTLKIAIKDGKEFAP